MQNLFLKLQKSTAIALTLLTVFATVSCNNDDDLAIAPDPQTFAGLLSTTIPSMLDFEPVKSDIEAKITWLNSKQSVAKIDLGAFTIETGMPGRGYEIESMKITDIIYTKVADGSFALLQNAFTCQSGNYLTTGSLKGTYYNDMLTFTITYKPGSMPFDVESTFVSK